MRNTLIYSTYTEATAPIPSVTVQPLLTIGAIPHAQAGGTTVFERLAADTARKGAGSSVGDHGMRRTVSTKHGLSVGATRRGGQVCAATLLLQF